MNLSEAGAEERLIKVGRMTREEIEKAKSTGFRKMAEIFVDAVKRDYSAFFPFEPDLRRLEHEAKQLFRYGNKKSLLSKSLTNFNLLGFGSFSEKAEIKKRFSRKNDTFSCESREKANEARRGERRENPSNEQNKEDWLRTKQEMDDEALPR